MKRRTSHDHDRDRDDNRRPADLVIDDAQLAAAAFLARYSGHTLDAYRHDPRGFFQ